jgi:hypothetical protein
MLVRPHNGGIDDQVFEVRIFTQLGEKSLPDALFGPPPETSEHAVPVAKLFGQVAPRRAGTDQPQDGIDEQTIIRAVPALVAFLPGISGSIRCHCPSVNARRIKIALNHIRESGARESFHGGDSASSRWETLI